MTDLTLHHAAHSFDRHHGVAAAPNQFEAGSYRGERISQFVREHRQELVFSRIGVPQLLLGAGAFDGLPRPLRGFLDEFDFLWSPRARRKRRPRRAPRPAWRPESTAPQRTHRR